MGYGAESSFVGIVAAVVGIVLILTVVLRMWKKVPQDKAGVVTGMKKRVITGGGGLVIPVFERIDYISLGNIPLSVATRSSLSSQGVPISVITTAVIKVRNEKGSILTAIEQFTGRNEKEIIDNIQGTAIAVLEGKLREIIATMTVEELYQKREEFSSRVQEVVGTELGNMGLEVKNFTITDISDENGYIKALGDGMIAQRKKDAEIQKAEAARDMQIKTSQARQEGESAKLKAEADIAQAAKDKAVLEANYMQEQQTAQAKAELAHDIQSNITQKDVIQAQMDAELLKQQRQKEIAEAQIQVQIASEQKNIELAQKQAERTKESLRVTIVEPANAEKAKQMADADAEKYRKIAEAEARAESRKVEAQAEAEAIALKAQAEADAIAKTGIAEAEATKAKGIAEAEAMEKKAEAYEKYGQAAMMEMLVKVLPQMAEQVAKPLQSIDKVTIIDSGDTANGSGVGQMGGYVPSVLAKTIESIKETTGFAHRLLSPKHHVDKVYEAIVKGKIADKYVEEFAKGLYVDSEFTAMPAELKIISYDDNSDSTHINITIREGKYHQIKRMFTAIGSEVLFLKRLSMGGITLDRKLATGSYRVLTDDEIAILKDF